MKPRLLATIVVTLFLAIFGCSKPEKMYLVTFDAFNLNPSESPNLVMWFAYEVDPPIFDTIHHTYHARGMVSERNINKSWMMYKLRPSTHDSIGFSLETIYDNTRTLYQKASEASPKGGTSVLHQELKISDAL